MLIRGKSRAAATIFLERVFQRKCTFLLDISGITNYKTLTSKFRIGHERVEQITGNQFLLLEIGSPEENLQKIYDNAT